MSLLSRSLSLKAAPTPSDYRRLDSPPYSIINNRLVAYPDNKDTFFTKGYNINDIVYSIVKMIMDKIAVAPWGVYRVKDESAYKSYQGMLKKKDWGAKDFSTMRGLQHKALEAVQNPGKLGELLQYPNEQDSMSDLVAHGAGFKMLTGDLYLWANILSGGLNKGMPNELQLLPSQYISIYCTDTFPSRVTGYEFSLIPGRRFEAKEVMHTKYANFDYTVAGAQHYGIAPLRAALNLLQRNNSSMTASASAFKNEGIKGIISMDNQMGQVDGDLAAQEAGALAETMRTEWMGERNKGKMGISGYKLNWIPIGLTSEDMQLIESEKWDMRRLCSIFGVQSQLFNDPDNKTYANQEEAEKSLTTRAALPHLTSFRDNLNRKLKNNWGGKPGEVVDFDMTVFTELQQDTKEMVGWLTPLMDRGLPINRVLELLNLEKIDDPYYDMPRVTTTMGQTIEEHNLNDVETALNESPDDEEDI